MVRMALGLLALLVPLQMILGDQHGLNTLEYQPAKLAAIEGRCDTDASPSPLTLFGIPDAGRGANAYAIDIPCLGSLILTHSLERRDQGPEGMAGRTNGRPSPVLLRLPRHGRHRLHHAGR